MTNIINYIFKTEIEKKCPEDGLFDTTLNKALDVSAKLSMIGIMLLLKPGSIKEFTRWILTGDNEPKDNNQTKSKMLE